MAAYPSKVLRKVTPPKRAIHRHYYFSRGEEGKEKPPFVVFWILAPFLPLGVRGYMAIKQRI